MNYRFYTRPNIPWPIERLLASGEKFHSEYFLRFSCKSFRYIDCFDMKLKFWSIPWKEGVGPFLNLLRGKCQTFILYFYNRRHLQLFRKLRIVQQFQRIAHEMHAIVGFRTPTRISNFCQHIQLDSKWPLHLSLIADQINTLTCLNTKKSCFSSNNPEY